MNNCNTMKWEPEKWNLTDEENEFTNCYSYILNRIESNIDSKLQPGELSGEEFKTYDCHEIANKMENLYLQLSQAQEELDKMKRKNRPKNRGLMEVIKGWFK